MLFDGWASIGRIAFLAVASYLLLIVALRLAGAQALGKMSAYNLVITIALGSIVATIPLGTGVTLADGVALIVIYLGLQRLLRRALKMKPRWQRIAKNKPRIVVWNGVQLESEMQAVDVTASEVLAAIRKAGRGSLGDVQAVVLENDGEWSVIGRASAGDLSAMSDIPLPGGSRSNPTNSPVTHTST
jgi:uncharacterized membrane protein YcaP (DUF421 family)